MFWPQSSLLPHGFLDAVHPRDYERLTEDFLKVADSVAFNILADDIVGKVFSGPLLVIGGI